MKEHPEKAMKMMTIILFIGLFCFWSAPDRGDVAYPTFEQQFYYVTGVLLCCGFLLLYAWVALHWFADFLVRCGRGIDAFRNEDRDK